MLDGHDRCPSCLGLQHLEDALSNPCPDCSIMPFELRQQRLASISPSASELLTPAAVDTRGTKRKRPDVEEHRKLKRRASSSKLAKRMDELTTTVQRLQALLSGPTMSAVNDSMDQTDNATHLNAHVPLLTEHPPNVEPEESDAISLAATDSLLSESNDQQAHVAQQPSRPSSLYTVSGSGSESESGASVAMSMRGNIKMALAKLNLDVPNAQSGPTNLLCRSVPGSKEVIIPHCKDFTEVVSAAFRSALSFRPDRVARMLSDMSAPDTTGLGSMPALEPCVASLIVSPDEALRPDVRCPNKECRRTDNALVKTYNTVARLGRIGNSMGHLLSALHATLDSTSTDDSVSGLLDASLQALGAMASDCGRALGLLAHARRQVWLAQSSLPEACRNNLRQLPLTPGHLFGPAAQEALERRVRVTESRSQHAARRSGFDDPRVSVRPNRQAPPQPVPARSPNRFFRGQYARPTHLAHHGASNQRSRPWPARQPPRQRPPKANEPASRRR